MKVSKECTHYITFTKEELDNLLKSQVANAMGGRVTVADIDLYRGELQELTFIYVEK